MNNLEKIISIISAIMIILSIIIIIKKKKEKTKNIFGIILCIFIVSLSLSVIRPLFNSVNFGLDLKGGFEVLYQVESLNENEKVNSDMVYRTYKTLLNRIDVLGVSEPEITIEGENRIRVRLAGIKNQDEARQILSTTASITFRDAYDKLLMTSDVLGGSVKKTTDNNLKPAIALPIKDVETFYNVTNKVKDMDENIIVIWLDYDAKKDSYHINGNKCGNLNESNCLSAAHVSQAFSSDVIIQGNFTDEQAKNLVDLINSGSMPSKLEELSSRTVQASFGENSLSKTVFAGILGIILVIILMTIIYHFSGLIASIGIILYTVLTFGLFYLINGVLTLPGIAAMLLGVGMSVDAIVISFERIKEELRNKKQLNNAFKIGNSESLRSIIDANITTIIVAIILFIFGESSIKGFATMLIISIIVTVFVMIILVRLILKIFANNKMFENKLRLFIGYKKNSVHDKERFKKLEFVKNRKIFFIGTIIILIIGFIFIFKNGMNLGVDFSGGSDITINLNENITNEKAIEYITNENLIINKIEENDKTLSIIVTEQLNKEKINEITNHINTEYNAHTEIYVVSQTVKKELAKNAITSVLLSFIGIIIYVSIRFKFNYAISGIAALLHDILITISIFAILKIQVETTFIAALLTIIGYSINDTIVTFDRIRENYNKLKQIVTFDQLEKIVNESIRETIYRSILTTLTTIIPVICLMIFGAFEIINFNFALLIGFIAGVYSSIYVSNQLWLIFELKKINKPKKETKYNDGPEEFSIKGINS